MKVLSLFERKVMEFREFGDKDRPVVMLLHGGSALMLCTGTRFCGKQGKR